MTKLEPTTHPESESDLEQRIIDREKRMEAFPDAVREWAQQLISAAFAQDQVDRDTYGDQHALRFLPTDEVDGSWSDDVLHRVGMPQLGGK